MRNSRSTLAVLASTADASTGVASRRHAPRQDRDIVQTAVAAGSSRR